MSQLSRDDRVDGAQLHPIDIVREILEEVGSLSRLMEVHYLVQEPGLLDIMRVLGGLSEGDRVRLREYLVGRRQSRLRVRQLAVGRLSVEWLDDDRIEKSA